MPGTEDYDYRTVAVLVFPATSPRFELIDNWGRARHAVDGQLGRQGDRLRAARRRDLRGAGMVGNDDTARSRWPSPPTISGPRAAPSTSPSTGCVNVRSWQAAS
ncbi:hypothetical protein GS432_01640 [Rhodococcus hoagii]|nr:hypothetical protein [Prescottella equi]